MVLSLLQNLLRPSFGHFEKEELKKFLLLGLIFGLIIGIYWALRPMKDSFFQDIVGGTWQPRAKMLSLLTVFPLVMAYSKLVEKLPRHALFYTLSLVYGTLTLIFAWYMFDPVVGLANTQADPNRILGWAWYVFIESFGSLFVALFWAFATDITTAESGKKGFSLVVLIGQMGGILGPLLIGRLPKLLGLGNAYSVLFVGLITFLIIPMVMLFRANVAPEQLVGYVEKGHENPDVEPGFFEGLILMLKQPYLLGILGIITFYEVIVTVFDYYFKIMVEAKILDKAAKHVYLTDYAIYANAATFLCLVLGISNIQRKLGLTTSLTLMPVFVGFAVIIFSFYPQVGPFFWLMVLSKAINYALNSPTQKQLYIPTTHDVRFKSQAWIESFGSRGSKALGSGLNDYHKVLLAKNGPEWTIEGTSKLNPEFVQKNMFSSIDKGTMFHMALSSYIFLGVIALWVVVALYLGRTYQRAVDTNKVVC